MRTDEAVTLLARQPEHAHLVEDLYLDDDRANAARRFSGSAEFQAVRELVGDNLSGGTVLDLGAGAGIASAALADAGAAQVVAVEPDPSDLVGIGGLRRACGDRQVAGVRSWAEGLPFADGTFHLVYCRQILHHTSDLDRALEECARVLRPGGQVMATREHVVDDDEQLEAFLGAHPVHQLAGGEHAYACERYVAAIERAGLRVEHCMGPWDSVINAYPVVANQVELGRAPEIVLGRRYGRLGASAGRLPGIRELVWRRLRRPDPGRLYSFVATKS